MSGLNQIIGPSGIQKFLSILALNRIQLPNILHRFLAIVFLVKVWWFGRDMWLAKSSQPSDKSFEWVGTVLSRMLVRFSEAGEGEAGAVNSWPSAPNPN